MDRDLPEDPSNEDKVEDATNQNFPMMDMTGTKRGLDMDIYMKKEEEDMNLNLDDPKEEKIEEKRCN